MNATKSSQRSFLLIALFLVAATVAGYFAWKNPGQSLVPRPYSIGDVAGEDITAPRKLSLVDSAETELRRERELTKGPVLFRFDKSISAKAVARFNKEVADTRESFLDNVQKAFNTRTLATNQVDGAVFRQLVIDFRRDHSQFPITVVKAARWAQGDSEEKLQKQLSDKLRSAARKLVHPDGWPAAAHGDHLRLVGSEVISGTSIDLIGQSQLVRRTNIVAISKVREALRAQLPREQFATAQFLAGFVEVNCVFDADLTQRLREQRAARIEVIDTFGKGQLIVQRGEKVDGKIKDALDELNIKKIPAAERGGFRRIGLWSLGIFFMALAMFVYLRLGERPGNKLVPVQNVVALPGTGDATLESKLIPHLARAMMNKLVRGLISQREQLMTVQSAGTEQLNELEEKLEQISSRLQSRQTAYERRIAELEKELAAAEEENRELIRAKIREARENLEWAKAQAAKQ
ncbi:MAG: hypothetical protein ABIQ35_01165 [Verrucomicrobiota bacterium]